MKAWSESRGTHGIALNGEDWYDVRHGRLIITPDRTAKEELYYDRGEKYKDSQICTVHCDEQKRFIVMVMRDYAVLYHYTL